MYRRITPLVWMLALVFAQDCARAAEPLRVEPYVEPSHLDVPWPKHSHVKMPWRGYLETKPAVELLDGIGVAYHHHGGSVEVQIGLLAKAGVRCIRWEQPLGTYDPDTGSIDERSQARYREVLRACRQFGVTPIVLLNAHHGYPCKMKSSERRVMADAPEGSRELVLDSVEGLRPVHSGSGGLTGGDDVSRDAARAAGQAERERIRSTGRPPRFRPRRRACRGRGHAGPAHPRHAAAARDRGGGLSQPGRAVTACRV